MRVLVSRPAWKDYQVTQEREEGKDGREQKHMACMLHITPASIIETNEEYRAWMHSFGPATQVDTLLSWKTKFLDEEKKDSQVSFPFC